MIYVRAIVGLFALLLCTAAWTMNDNQQMLFFGIVAIAVMPK